MFYHYLIIRPLLFNAARRPDPFNMVQGVLYPSLVIATYRVVLSKIVPDWMKISTCVGYYTQDPVRFLPVAFPAIWLPVIELPDGFDCCINVNLLRSGLDSVSFTIFLPLAQNFFLFVYSTGEKFEIILWIRIDVTIISLYKWIWVQVIVIVFTWLVVLK